MWVLQAYEKVSDDITNKSSYKPWVCDNRNRIIKCRKYIHCRKIEIEMYV